MFRAPPPLGINPISQSRFAPDFPVELRFNFDAGVTQEAFRIARIHHGVRQKLGVHDSANNQRTVPALVVENLFG
jgi:hypothetical protein